MVKELVSKTSGFYPCRFKRNADACAVSEAEYPVPGVVFYLKLVLLAFFYLDVENLFS